jgi:lysophospholipase L1-like esterase
MADLDASCFVIDCLPNCTPELMRDNYIRFFQILRDKNPQVPILLVENLHYSHMAFSTSVNETVNAKNTLLQEMYRELKKKGDRRVYYLKADNLIGNDLEPSVDGVHLTDLGFLRLAQNMYPVIRKLIR